MYRMIPDMAAPFAGSFRRKCCVNVTLPSHWSSFNAITSSTFAVAGRSGITLPISSIPPIVSTVNDVGGTVLSISGIFSPYICHPWSIDASQRITPSLSDVISAEVFQLTWLEMAADASGQNIPIAAARKSMNGVAILVMSCICESLWFVGRYFYRECFRFWRHAVLIVAGHVYDCEVDFCLAIAL